jgi:hypothetical protein
MDQMMKRDIERCLPLPRTPLRSADLEKYSSATTLTVIELELFPELVQAQWLANMMSPSLWEWIATIPKRSGSPTRRRVEGIKQNIIHNYSFTHMENEPGLCPCGVTTIRAEERRFADTALKRYMFERVKQTFLQGELTSLADLLGVEDIREYYGLSDYPRGAIPLWGNEVLEKMDAYRFITPDGKGSGKCESLAVLYAAALIVVGKFPWQHVSVWFTPAHVMTYLMEGNGYLSSNKRMFSPVSLRSENEHTAVVRSCLKNERVVRVQTTFGTIHDVLSTYSIAPDALRALYSHLTKYAASAAIDSLGSWPLLQGKHHVDFSATPDFGGMERAAEVREAVRRLAQNLAGSIFDLSRYAFRDLEVPYPEVYAYAARRRSPKARDAAEGLGSVDKIVEFVQSGASIGPESIFGSTERIAMPDEVLIFGRGDHRDRALLLYAMVTALEAEMPEPLVVFAREGSYVLHLGHVLHAQRGPEAGGEIALVFNSRGCIRNPGAAAKDLEMSL